MKFDKMIPEVYYKESRDFSFVGRVIEVMLNYLKTNVDLVGQYPINNNEASSSLIELMATTLGFESKHKYQNKDLVSLCSVFALLLRNKGNKKSIEDAITTLMRSQGIDDTFSIEADPNEDYKYVIYVPQKLNDIVLLEDIYEYILPAGWNYTIRMLSSGSGTYSDSVSAKDDVNVQVLQSYQLGQVGGKFDNEGNVVDDYNTLDTTFENWYVEYQNLSTSRPSNPIEGNLYITIDSSSRGTLHRYNGTSWDNVEGYVKFPSARPTTPKVGDIYCRSVNEDRTIFEILKCSSTQVEATNRSTIYTSTIPGDKVATKEEEVSNDKETNN